MYSNSNSNEMNVSSVSKGSRGILKSSSKDSTGAYSNKKTSSETDSHNKKYNRNINFKLQQPGLLVTPEQNQHLNCSAPNTRCMYSNPMQHNRSSSRSHSGSNPDQSNQSTKNASTYKNSSSPKLCPHHQQLGNLGKTSSKSNSCGRSHSYSSEFSAGCSASQLQNRSCSNESSNDSGLRINLAKIGGKLSGQNSGKNSRNDSVNAQVGYNSPLLGSRNCSHKIDSLENINENSSEALNFGAAHDPKSKTTSCESNSSIKQKRISGCCSNECDHHGPMFKNMRKFSNNQDFKKPDRDLAQKLIELIEYYLSDEYLAKDKYLLRQIRCKSEGYISIKLMTSFKKVKKLTRDWRTVRFALLQTDNLIVSPEGFRVKRAEALPESLRKPRLLSSVVSIKLNEEFSTVDAITGLFSKYGIISLVRILKPGKEIPSDLRNYATQVPDIGKSLCAVVDFEQSDSALQAVRCLKDFLLEQNIRLALLGPRVRRTLYKQDRTTDSDAQSIISEAATAKSVRSNHPTGIAENQEDILSDSLLAEQTPLAQSEAGSIKQFDGITKITSTVITSNGNAKANSTSYKNMLITRPLIKPVARKSIIPTIEIKLSRTLINKKEPPRQGSLESNESTSKTSDMSIDSGNYGSTGIQSNDDDINKAADLKEDDVKNGNSKAQSKVSIILREPEGPGVNPDLAGFAIKRKCLN